MPQPLDDLLGVAGHGCGGRVVDVLEDGVEHRVGPFDELFDVRGDVAVDVREEEELLVSLEHEAGEVHGSEVVLRLREVGHQRGQLFGERLGVRRMP